MSLNAIFCEGLQLQIVDMFFYFPWNLLSAKTKKNLQEISINLFKFSVWTSQPQNIFNFLFFIVFITKFQPLNQDLITLEKIFLLNK